jgi:hypothetical protein
MSMIWKTPFGRHRRTIGSSGSTMPFFHGFTEGQNGAFYQGPFGVNGNVNGFWVSAVMYYTPGLAQDPDGEISWAFTSADLATLTGWSLYLKSAGLSITANFSIGDGIAANTASVSLPLGSVSKPLGALSTVIVIPFMGIFDPGAHIVAIFAPSLIGVTPFNGAYSPPGLGTAQFLGGTGTTAAANAGINGVAGGVGVPNAGQIEAWFAAVEQAGRVAAIPALTDTIWCANDDISPAELEVPAPTKIVDEIGNLSLVLQGLPPSPVLITRYLPEFLT